jgi:hypothetical protein
LERDVLHRMSAWEPFPLTLREDCAASEQVVGENLFFATRSLRALTPAIQGANGTHIAPTGQDAWDGGPPSPMQPTLHTTLPPFTS